VFTIPNNAGMSSYKKGIENLLRAKNESHVLHSGENFVLSLLLNLQYTESSTKPLSQIWRNFLRSVYTQLRQLCNFALEHSLPAANQFLEHTLPNPDHTDHRSYVIPTITKVSTDLKVGCTKRH